MTPRPRGNTCRHASAIADALTTTPRWENDPAEEERQGRREGRSGKSRSRRSRPGPRDEEEGKVQGGELEKAQCPGRGRPDPDRPRRTDDRPRVDRRHGRAE